MLPFLISFSNGYVGRKNMVNDNSLVLIDKYISFTDINII